MAIYGGIVVTRYSSVTSQDQMKHVARLRTRTESIHHNMKSTMYAPPVFA